MSRKRNIVGLPGVLVMIGLSGCATWSTSSVDTGDVQPATAAQPTSRDKILVTAGDLASRNYSSLGDITVTVNKTTIFHAEPTREMVNQKLREEAAKLGADAVIHVRYGDPGISALSWGSLEGKGRAIKFVD
jgi:uncharacterized protein YbjQ (UPF0145 family)